MCYNVCAGLNFTVGKAVTYSHQDSSTSAAITQKGQIPGQLLQVPPLSTFCWILECRYNECQKWASNAKTSGLLTSMRDVNNQFLLLKLIAFNYID